MHDQEQHGEGATALRRRLLASKISWVIDAARRALLSKRFPLAIVAAGIIVRLCWITAMPAQPTSDFGWYFQLGLRLADGQGYTATDDGFPLWKEGHPLAEPRPTAFWPVGYPGFLAALFLATKGLDPLWIGKIANIILYVGVMLAAAYVARAIFRSVLAERITLLGLAFAPNQVAYSSLLSVEIWFSFLALFGIALILRANQQGRATELYAAGICFGLATLTKPQAVLLPAVVLAVIHRSNAKAAMRAAAAVYLPVVLCVGPWALRNSLAFGRPLFVSNNGGINLLIGNMPGSWGEHGVMWNRDLERIITTSNDELARDTSARQTALRYILSHPLEVLLSLPKKLFWLYAIDVDGFGWNRAATAEYRDSWIWTPLRALAQVYYLCSLLIVGMGVARLKRHSAQHFWLGPAVFAYFTLVYLVFFGGARFHFPLVPWIAIYAAATLAGWLETLPLRERTG